VNRHQLDPLSSGSSRARSWPLVATVTLQSFSWTTFGHASQTASNQQVTVQGVPWSCWPSALGKMEISSMCWKLGKPPLRRLPVNT